MAIRLLALFNLAFNILMCVSNVRYSSNIIPTYFTSLDSISLTPFKAVGGGVGTYFRIETPCFDKL